MTRRHFLVAALVAGASGQGCSDQGPDQVLFAQLAAARDRWVAGRPTRYAYTLERVCDCPSDQSGPVRVEVDGASVASRVYLSGATVPEALVSLFPSVDQLFTLIDDAIAAGAWEVRVSYDPGSGVPLNVRIDYEPLEFGEEVAYRTVALPTALAATFGRAPGI